MSDDKMKYDAYAVFVADDKKTGWDARCFFDAGWQAALERKPEVNQPYAYMRKDSGGGRYHESWILCGAKAEGAIPLFTSPQDYEATLVCLNCGDVVLTAPKGEE